MITGQEQGNKAGIVQKMTSRRDAEQRLMDRPVVNTGAQMTRFLEVETSPVAFGLRKGKSFGLQNNCGLAAASRLGNEQIVVAVSDVTMALETSNPIEQRFAVRKVAANAHVR